MASLIITSYHESPIAHITSKKGRIFSVNQKVFVTILVSSFAHWQCLLKDGIETAHYVIFGEETCGMETKLTAYHTNGFVHGFDYALVTHV